MIVRIWHGWTTPEQADSYEQILKTEIFPGIASRKTQGYKGIQLLRRSYKEETEFITVMLFESLAAVKRFSGDDYEKAYVPAKAREVLLRFDEYSQHYEIREDLNY